MDAAEWNARYRANTVWSGQPNDALVAHAPRPVAGSAGSGVSESAERRPTALDLGCGEGADALWLAAQGWDVTGVDWAGVALDRAREVAARAQSDVRFVEGDITDLAFLTGLSPTGTFDLVCVAFLHPEPEDRSHLYSALPGLVAPDGHLLVITHDPEHGRRGLPGPPAHRLLSAEDIVAALELPAGVEVLIRATDSRAGEEGVVAVDSVVLVRRGSA